MDKSLKHPLRLALLFPHGVRSVSHPGCDGIQADTPKFFAPLSFPDVVDLGLRITKLGNSSVTYEVGVFKSGEDSPSAVGGYTHVFVERERRKSVLIGAEAREGLRKLLVERRESSRL